jgi:hypothetical protein
MLLLVRNLLLTCIRYLSLIRKTVLVRGLWGVCKRRLSVHGRRSGEVWVHEGFLGSDSLGRIKLEKALKKIDC